MFEIRKETSLKIVIPMTARGVRKDSAGTPESPCRKWLYNLKKAYERPVTPLDVLKARMNARRRSA